MSDFGNSKLFTASATGQLDIVKEILESEEKFSEIPCSLANNRLTTPLIIACARKNNIEVIKLLLDRNVCSLNAIDKNGWSALGLSLKYGHKDYVKMLVHHGADYNRYIGGIVDVSGLIGLANLREAIKLRKSFEINFIDLASRKFGRKLPLELLKKIYEF